MAENEQLEDPYQEVVRENMAQVEQTNSLNEEQDYD